ncbi:helix-turn-helix domain-containing protein [uncultured Methylobacterium sp.]|uniref:helix-turn-helix domain-containing protein n=1 Tax=uncultured Methylobacterium sp. TaxID=157278 RepID=UPI002622D8E0|nr:helix-turn-helix domain-containing protein [uncultured Methylobacterium sp.]
MSHALNAGAVEAAPQALGSPTAYRLPRAVADRLDAALQGRKNAPACLALAHFIARFWSSPKRLLCAFPIDRRALAEHDALGLTEARVRGALAVLVEIGFLARYEPDAGKRYQRTDSGLQRRAILHRFGEEYGVEFGKANARAQAARGAPTPARRPVAASAPSRPPVNLTAPHQARAATGTAPIQLAQNHISGGSRMIMGEQIQPEPESRLEAAFARLGRAIGGKSSLWC